MAARAAAFEELTMKTSAGILLYRDRGNGIEVLLAHPGGPLYQNKDAGVWTIPKGEYGQDEDAREFGEETGGKAPLDLTPLQPVTRKSGKRITIFAGEGDIDADAIKSNTFLFEWPPKSGKQREFPEIDRAAWFTQADSLAKIEEAQTPILRELYAKIEAAAMADTTRLDRADEQLREMARIIDAQGAAANASTEPDAYRAFLAEAAASEDDAIALYARGITAAPAEDVPALLEILTDEIDHRKIIARLAAEQQ